MSSLHSLANGSPAADWANPAIILGYARGTVAQAGSGDDYTYRIRRDIAGTRSALVRTDAALRNRELPPAIAAASRILLLGCGHSAMHAAAAGLAWLERLSGLPCDVEPASAWLSHPSQTKAGTVAIVMSRTGEAADAMTTFRVLRAQSIPSVALTAEPTTHLASQADMLWAAEVGAQSAPTATKSISVQLMALLRFGITLGAARGTLRDAALETAELAIGDAPVAAALAEAAEARYAAIACRLALGRPPLLIGRGGSSAIAAHGAEYLQELAELAPRCHAGVDMAGGVAALVAKGTPVIICAEADTQLTHSVADAAEASAHGAEVIALVESRADWEFERVAHDIVALPGRGFANLFAQLMAIQLIAYHTALSLGMEVDSPDTILN